MPTTLVIGLLRKNMSHCCKLLSPCKYSLEGLMLLSYNIYLCVCVCVCVCAHKGAWTATVLGNATR